jgi:hypothetical protein
MESTLEAWTTSPVAGTGLLDDLLLDDLLLDHGVGLVGFL